MTMLRKLIIGLIPLMAACSDSPTTTQVCAKTVENYTKYRDNPALAKPYTKLFTEDGTFTLGPDRVSGRDEIMARHLEAHKNAVWQHKMENISLDEQDGMISGTSRVTVKTSPKDNLKIKRTIVANYIDNFEMVGDACLIKSRTVKILTDDTVTTN